MALRRRVRVSRRTCRWPSAAPARARPPRRSRASAGAFSRQSVRRGQQDRSHVLGQGVVRKPRVVQRLRQPPAARPQLRAQRLGHRPADRERAVSALVSGQRRTRSPSPSGHCTPRRWKEIAAAVHGKDRLAGRSARGQAVEAGDGDRHAQATGPVPDAGPDRASRARVPTGPACASTSPRCCTAWARGSTSKPELLFALARRRPRGAHQRSRRRYSAPRRARLRRTQGDQERRPVGAVRYRGGGAGDANPRRRRDQQRGTAISDESAKARPACRGLRFCHLAPRKRGEVGEPLSLTPKGSPRSSSCVSWTDILAPRPAKAGEVGGRRPPGEGYGAAIRGGPLSLTLSPLRGARANRCGDSGRLRFAPRPAKAGRGRRPKAAGRGARRRDRSGPLSLTLSPLRGARANSCSVRRNPRGRLCISAPRPAKRGEVGGRRPPGEGYGAAKEGEPSPLPSPRFAGRGQQPQ